MLKGSISTYRRETFDPIPDARESSAKEHISVQFKTLIDKGKYIELASLGEGMKNDEFLKHLCPIMTTLNHYEGLVECLKNRGMLADFIANGSMMLVKRILEFKGATLYIALAQEMYPMQSFRL